MAGSLVTRKLTALGNCQLDWRDAVNSSEIIFVDSGVVSNPSQNDEIVVCTIPSGQKATLLGATVSCSATGQFRLARDDQTATPTDYAIGAYYGAGTGEIQPPLGLCSLGAGDQVKIVADQSLTGNVRAFLYLEVISAT